MQAIQEILINLIVGQNDGYAKEVYFKILEEIKRKIRKIDFLTEKEKVET